MYDRKRPDRVGCLFYHDSMVVDVLVMAATDVVMVYLCLPVALINPFHWYYLARIPLKIY